MPERVDVAITFIPHPSVIAKTFFTASEKLSHIDIPMQEAVEVFISEIDLNFEVEGRPPWAPWARETLNKKIRSKTDKIDRVEAMLGTKEHIKSWRTAIVQSQGLKILHDTGDLRKEATDPANWHVERHGPEASVTLTDIPEYGPMHLKGGSRLPQRFWANISFKAIDEIEDIFQDWIGDAFA